MGKVWFAYNKFIIFGPFFQTLPLIHYPVYTYTVLGLEKNETNYLNLTFGVNLAEFTVKVPADEAEQLALSSHTNT